MSVEGQIRLEQVLGLLTALDGKKEFNGYEEQSPVTGTTMAMNGGNFEISGTYAVWVGGVRYAKSGTPAESVAITNDLTQHFVYYNTLGLLQVSTTPWNLLDDNAPIATVYKDGTNYSITDERHYYDRDRALHRWAHFTIGARYGDGLSGTFDITPLSIETGFTYDEELRRDVLSTATTCKRWYRGIKTGPGLDTMRLDATPSTTPYITAASILQYDLNGVLTDVQNNWYSNVYIYASGDVNVPVAALIGQGNYSNLSGAQNEPFPQILLPTAEIKLLYRVTYQRVGTSVVYVAATDFRKQSTGPAVEGGSISHASTTGRADPNQHPASAIQMPFVPGATYDALDDWFNAHSSGVLTGGVVSASATPGTVDVTAGTGVIKSVDSEVGPLSFFDFGSKTALALPADNTLNFIYVDYDSGPDVVASANPSHTGQKKFLLATVYKKGTAVWVNGVAQNTADTLAKLTGRLGEIDGVQRHTGMIASEVATQYLALTAGNGWNTLHRFSTPAFDTSGAGSDTFDLWYRDGAGGYTRSTAANPRAVDNIYYDNGSGTPAAIPSNKYSVRWVFVVPNGADSLHVVYGRSSSGYLGYYSSLAEARSEPFPADLPYLFTYMGVLCARVIVQEGSAGFTAVDTLFGEDIAHVPVSTHNELGGLQGGQADQYYHLTAAEYATLGSAALPWTMIKTSDNLVAILNAATAGSVFYLEQGVHAVTAPITIPNSNVTVLGTHGSILDVDLTTQAVDLFTIVDKENVTLDGFKIEANLDDGYKVIRFKANPGYIRNLRIKDIWCDIENTYADFIFSDGNGNLADRMRDVTISGNYATGNVRNGIYIDFQNSGNASAHQFTLANNRLVTSDASAVWGIRYEGSEGASNGTPASISGNQCRGFGIWVKSGDISVIDNLVESPIGDGFNIAAARGLLANCSATGVPATDYGFYLAMPSGVVSNCEAVGGLDGFYVASSDMSLTNCTSTDAASNGFEHGGGGADCRLTSCYAVGSGADGFYIDGFNNVFSNCRAESCGSTSVQHGFHIRAAANHFISCYATGCYGNGFTGQGSQSSDSSFRDCIAISNGDPTGVAGSASAVGFSLEGSPRSIVSACMSRSNAGGGYVVSSGSEHSRISGCLSTSDGSATGDYGISITSAEVAVNGCFVSGAWDSGVYVNGADCTVDATYSIDNGDFLGVSGTTDALGFEIEAGADRAQITACYSSNNAGRGYYTSGTNTLFKTSYSLNDRSTGFQMNGSDGSLQSCYTFGAQHAVESFTNPSTIVFNGDLTDRMKVGANFSIVGATNSANNGTKTVSTIDYGVTTPGKTTVVITATNLVTEGPTSAIAQTSGTGFDCSSVSLMTGCYAYSCATGFSVDSADATVSGCIAHTCSGAGFINTGARVQINACYAYNGYGQGFSGGGQEAAFDGCYAYNNDSYGFFCQGTRQTFTGCVAHSCSAGYDLGYESKLSNCHAISNTGKGFALKSDGRDATLSGCSAYGNGAFGFDVRGATRSNLSGCYSYSNGDSGYNETGGYNNFVGCFSYNDGNAANENGFECTGLHTSLVGCYVSGSWDAGIYMTGAQSHVDGCVVYQAGRTTTGVADAEGIHVTGARSTISDCWVRSSNGIGILAAGSDGIVSGCYTYQTGGIGISTTASPFLVEGCYVLSASGTSGFSVGGTKSQVTGCVASSCAIGFDLTNDLGVTGCFALSNTGVGFSGGAFRNNFTGCSAWANGGAGFSDGIQHDFTGCWSYQNAGDGFSVGNYSTMSGCYAFGNGITAGDNYDITGSYSSFTGCWSRGSKAHGFHVAGIQNQLTGCKSVGDGDAGDEYGFYVTGTSISLSACQVDNSFDHGIYVTGDRAQITNCRAMSCGDATITDACGIAMLGSDYSMVSGCYSESSIDHGLWLDQCTYCKITGNYLYTNGDWGVQEDSDCSNNDLSDNRYEGNTTGKLNPEGTAHVNTQSMVVACSDETTDLTTATPAITFRMTHAFCLTDVRASVNTAPVGSTIIVDINEGGSTIMTTNKLSIDAGSKTSVGATTPPGITDRNLADDAEMTVDIDQVGSTTAGKGLKVALMGYKV